MGVADGTKALKSSTRVGKSLASIRDQHRNPVVGIDVSIFMMMALRTKGALEELNMEPKVPVTSQFAVMTL